MGTISRTEPVEVAHGDRREPFYGTTDVYGSEALGTEETGPQYLEESDLAFDKSPLHVLRAVPVAIETRKLVVVEYGQQALQVTLDGTGAGQVDYGIIPPNQWWIIDNVIGAAGAAGNITLYERGAVGQINPMDLIYAKTLNAPGFVVSDFPNAEILRPGAHVIGGFIGCGNNAVATHKIKYRVCVMTPGRQEIDVP